MNPDNVLLEGEPMGREEFLQGHDKLPEQPKSWGFQQLLTCSNLDVGREDELLYVSVEDFNLINSGSVQGFEPESCITQVSETFSSSLSKHNREAKYQRSGQEEGISSASCSEPLYSSGNKKGTCSTHSPATNKREGRKRKRSKVCNKGEAESQRMTHIAVERNRRKQMNQHLNVLKSLMPDSFVQRGDQASIIGGAIDFVKELQHVLLSLEAQKSRNQCDEEGCQSPSRSSAIPNGFFRSYSPFDKNARYFEQPFASKLAAQSKSTLADVEVITMTETRAALKVVSKKRPGQILHTISALQNLAISILHMSISTISQSVLYSFNLKLEEECRVKSAEEIASAVQQILSMISLDETRMAAS